LADAYTVVRNTIRELRDAVVKFDGEKVTTENLDVWSCKKIVALHLYIKPYLNIVKKRFKKIHYVDLFSGSGLAEIQKKIMPGTPLIPLIVMKGDFNFDKYIFGDRKQEYVSNLEDRANRLYDKKIPNLHVEKNEFDNMVDKIFSGKWPTYNYFDNAYLVVLDPFGMEVSWNKLVKILGSGSVDLILTFMTWGFQRNKTIPRSESAMTRVFGNEDWKQKTDFVKLYCDQIEKLRLGNIKPFKTNVLAVQTVAGNEYHLIFVSTSEEGAQKIFSWIKDHIDQVSLKLLKDAFQGATVKGSNIDDWM